jgi:hypothetical protein
VWTCSYSQCNNKSIWIRQLVTLFWLLWLQIMLSLRYITLLAVTTWVQYYTVSHLQTSWKWLSSVFSQNKLYFAIHIFIVDGFTLLKIDPASCLKLKSYNYNFPLKFTFYFEQEYGNLTAIPISHIYTNIIKWI